LQKAKQSYIDVGGFFFLFLFFFLHINILFRKRMKLKQDGNLIGTEAPYLNDTHVNTDNTQSTQIFSKENQPNSETLAEKAVEMNGPSSDDHQYADAKEESDVETDDGYLVPYEHLVNENIEPPACYDALTKTAEPAHYEELKSENIQLACYEDLKAENVEPKFSDQSSTKKAVPVHYEGLIIEKIEPACYEALRMDR
jgi:hypothetical protein